MSQGPRGRDRTKITHSHREGEKLNLTSISNKFPGTAGWTAGEEWGGCEMGTQILTGVSPLGCLLGDTHICPPLAVDNNAAVLSLTENAQVALPGASSGWTLDRSHHSELGHIPAHLGSWSRGWEGGYCHIMAQCPLVPGHWDAVDSEGRLATRITLEP